MSMSRSILIFRRFPIWQLTPTRLYCRHFSNSSATAFAMYKMHNDKEHRKGIFTSADRTSKTSGPEGGFIVLLPDMPPDSPESNPLLNPSQIPNFDKLDPIAWRNALLKLSFEMENKVWELEAEISKDPSKAWTIDELTKQLDDVSVPLDFVWSLLKTVSVVRSNTLPSDGYNKLHERGRVARNKKFYSESLYRVWRDLSIPKVSLPLSPPQSRLINKYLTESTLSGVQLTGNAKAQFNNNTQKLVEARNRYALNHKMATIAFQHLIIDSRYVGDMPHEGLISISKSGTDTNAERGPWVVRLTSPAYEYFMEYCPERALRWNTWRAHVSRASGENDSNLNNGIMIEEIRSLRAAQAKLLGYETYADLSMVTKMAGTIQNVKTMIASLFVVASPKQSEEMSSLQTFAESRGFEHKLKLWDIPYWRRKQCRYLYNVDSSLVSSYFPYPIVLSRMMSFASELFDIEIRKSNAVKGWHEDVEYYEVSDGNGHLGSFFIDPYSRPGEKLPKSSWMLANRSRYNSMNLSPIATLVYNFSPPIYGKPCLLSFGDVYTLFEKFGQMMQHVLTAITYPEVSGTTNIEWDATGVAGKFMTMWLGNKPFVSTLSSHHETGDSIPEQILGDLLRSRKHFAAYDLTHQLYLSDLDIELHSKPEFWLDQMKRLWSLYKSSAGLLLDRADTHPCNFPDIFSGVHAASYYSNLWSRMLAADVYRAFVGERKDPEHWKVEGARFRSTFLALGGGYHPSEVFRLFRGRDPCPDALLWSVGLEKSKPKIELETTDDKLKDETPVDNSKVASKSS